MFSMLQLDMDFAHLFPQKDKLLIKKFDIFKEKLKIHISNSNINFKLYKKTLIQKIMSPH